MSGAWARTVWPASMVMTCPASGYRSSRPRSSGANSGTSFVFGPIRRSAITAVSVQRGGQQVRHQPAGPGGAAHRLAVHRDAGQPARPGDREDRRPGPRPGRQVRPGMVSELLRAHSGEHPHDGVRVRRHADPQRAAAAPRAASTCWRGAHPGGHVLQRAVPAQHRRRAQRQHRGQRCRIPRGSRGSGTAAKHSSRFPPDAARRRRHARRARPWPGSGAHGRGHARLDGQRGLPAGR